MKSLAVSAESRKPRFRRGGGGRPPQDQVEDARRRDQVDEATGRQRRGLADSDASAARALSRRDQVDDAAGAVPRRRDQVEDATGRDQVLEA
jgi:hypothetical protein